MSGEIVRAPRGSEPFTLLRRAFLNDDSLSFRARGVLAWILDKPDDWRTDSVAIANSGKEGREAIRSALKELEKAGYLAREKSQDEKGRWSTRTIVFDSPAPGEPAPGKPTPDSRALYQGLRPKTETEEAREASPPSEPEASGAKKLRKRDLVWDAVVEVIGWDPKGGEAKRVGKAVRLIREMCPADADDETIARAVHGRGRRYRAEWPNAELSPEALTKWWSRFGPKAGATEERERTRSDRNADPAMTTDAWAAQALTDEETAEVRRRIAWHAFTRRRAEERGSAWEATDPPEGWVPPEARESTVEATESSEQGEDGGTAA